MRWEVDSRRFFTESQPKNTYKPVLGLPAGSGHPCIDTAKYFTTGTKRPPTAISSPNPDNTTLMQQCTLGGAGAGGGGHHGAGCFLCTYVQRETSPCTHRETQNDDKKRGWRHSPQRDNQALGGHALSSSKPITSYERSSPARLGTGKRGREVDGLAGDPPATRPKCVPTLGMCRPVYPPCRTRITLALSIICNNLSSASGRQLWREPRRLSNTTNEKRTQQLPEDTKTPARTIRIPSRPELFS